MPWVDMEIVEGDSVKVTFMAKGGGSEYPSALKMIPPAEGIRGALKFVVETVYEAAAKPCPPVLVCVGVAGSADVAFKLSRRAMLKPLGVRHENPKVAELERKLLEWINGLGIGAHGFGGRTTALDVKFEYGARHPASYAVAVSFMCWAIRRATFVINSKGEWSITSKHYMYEG